MVFCILGSELLAAIKFVVYAVKIGVFIDQSRPTGRVRSRSRWQRRLLRVGC